MAETETFEGRKEASRVASPLSTLNSGGWGDRDRRYGGGRDREMKRGMARAKRGDKSMVTGRPGRGPGGEVQQSI